MTKSLRMLGLALLLMVNTVSANASQSSVPQPVKNSQPLTVPQPLKDLSQFKPLPVATGTFVQNKYFTVLKNPITATGEFFFDNELGFIWQTNKPIYSALLLKQDGLYSVDHLQQVKRVKNAGSIAAVLMNAISGDLTALQSTFTLSQNNDNQCVQLTPKDDVIAKVMRMIELCGTETVEHLVLFETSGNRTEIDVSLTAIDQLPEAMRAQLQ
jgi:hypothetical protein